MHNSVPPSAESWLSHVNDVASTDGMQAVGGGDEQAARRIHARRLA
jgi:hypothetical protein